MAGVVAVAGVGAGAGGATAGWPAAGVFTSVRVLAPDTETGEPSGVPQLVQYCIPAMVTRPVLPQLGHCTFDILLMVRVYHKRLG